MSEDKLKQLKIRLPIELKKFVEAEAERNRSSMGSEVVRAVRERMEKAQRKSGPDE